MRKSILIFLTIVFGSFIASSQTFDKKTILTKYLIGKAVVDWIKESDVDALGREFSNCPNLNGFVKIIKDKRHNADSLVMTPSIYYSPNDKAFVFTISAGKFINNGTDWGLFDYLFVIELRINSKVGEDVVTKRTIFVDDEIKLKSWWISFMQSYNNKECLRDEWADKFGLVPPPPPPPKRISWLKG